MARAATKASAGAMEREERLRDQLAAAQAEAAAAASSTTQGVRAAKQAAQMAKLTALSGLKKKVASVKRAHVALRSDAAGLKSALFADCARLAAAVANAGSAHGLMTKHASALATELGDARAVQRMQAEAYAAQFAALQKAVAAARYDNAEAQRRARLEASAHAIEARVAADRIAMLAEDVVNHEVTLAEQRATAAAAASAAAAAIHAGSEQREAIAAELVAATARGAAAEADAATQRLRATLLNGIITALHMPTTPSEEGTGGGMETTLATGKYTDATDIAAAGGAGHAGAAPSALRDQGCAATRRPFARGRVLHAVRMTPARRPAAVFDVDGTEEEGGGGGPFLPSYGPGLMWPAATWLRGALEPEGAHSAGLDADDPGAQGTTTAAARGLAILRMRWQGMRGAVSPAMSEVSTAAVASPNDVATSPAAVNTELRPAKRARPDEEQLAAIRQRAQAAHQLLRATDELVDESWTAKRAAPCTATNTHQALY
jgi:hypothetical protein